MNDSQVEVGTPLYLLESTEDCWKCGETQSVVGLAATRVRTAHENSLGGAEGEPALLSQITEMPEKLYMLIAAFNPRYKMHHSRTVGAQYYANTCQCGANFGDFYLFSEPGHAFFPTLAEEASQISITRLPLEGVVKLSCSLGWGTGGFIFANGTRC